MTAAVGSGRRSRADRADRGQATVEFALVLPVVLLVILAGIDVVVIARDAIAVQHAARLAARVAAVDGDAGRAAAVARSHVPDADVRIELAPIGGSVRATVHLRLGSRLGVLGRLRPDVEVNAAVSMRREGDPDG